MGVKKLYIRCCNSHCTTSSFYGCIIIHNETWLHLHFKWSVSLKNRCKKQISFLNIHTWCFIRHIWNETVLANMFHQILMYISIKVYPIWSLILLLFTVYFLWTYTSVTLVQLNVEYKFQDLQEIDNDRKHIPYIDSYLNLTYFVSSKFRTPCLIFQRHHRDT